MQKTILFLVVLNLIVGRYATEPADDEETILEKKLAEEGLD